MESIYRTHYCNALRASDAGKTVRLAGWVNNVRNLGSMVFLTLRDHYGLTQVVFPSDSPQELLQDALRLKPESVIFIEGLVQSRGKDVNPNMETGEIEVLCQKMTIDSLVEELPFPLNDILPSEDLRLKYRFIDLRRQRLHQNIVLRFKVMQALRNFLASKGFIEIQTPILTVSSPEGARDFVVPSRIHPGKFYALPQAPQQYKQLLMCSGFDKYFQIAPCFRDENARADRSPGEFYQLDMEMAFVTQDELFALLEEMYRVVVPQVCSKRVLQFPFPRIKYADSMEWYGNDKPDIRFDMRMHEVTQQFKNSNFQAFANAPCVKAILLKGTADKSNKFFKDAEAKAKELGASGLAYLNYKAEEIKGSIVKLLSPEELQSLRQALQAQDGDSIIFCAGERNAVNSIMGKLRVQLAEELGLVDKNLLAFCWIVDFPFYEWDEENGKIDFCHNPFSMPQGGLEVLQAATTKEAQLDIVAYQYDIVCNGIEISSGAIRNHRPDVMYKAFELAGYTREEVDARFGHMISAFTYGAPPHGGIAPGLDRMVMIFADEPNIREVIAFPLNQKAQDPMMGSPAPLLPKQLEELNLIINPKVL
jgi:aspartyl-tRNA synthetase